MSPETRAEIERLMRELKAHFPAPEEATTRAVTKAPRWLIVLAFIVGLDTCAVIDLREKVSNAQDAADEADDSGELEALQSRLEELENRVDELESYR